MPHKCVRCGKIYQSNSAELLKGCSCGTRIFLYLTAGDAAFNSSDVSKYANSPRVLELAKTQPVSLEFSSSAEDDVAEISGYLQASAPTSDSKSREQPAENITVIDRGEYELDISSIMRGDPLVVRSQNGIYYLKIPAPKARR